MITRLIIGIMAFTGLALADYTLDFNIVAPTLGTISYAGGTNPLVGSGISVDSLTTDTGTVVACSSCFFNFTSGSSTGGWNFGTGGTLSLSGSVMYNGNTVSGTLLSGTFNDASVIALGSTFKIAGADFLLQGVQIASLFGTPINDGNFNISFSTLPGITTGQAFTSTQMASGDILAGAPEPASIVLLGTILLGCVAIVRRRLA